MWGQGGFRTWVKRNKLLQFAIEFTRSGKIKMKSRILIKIGGQAFAGEDGFRDLATAIQSNQALEVIIVHGGGAEISQALKDADRETVFIDGIRVTQAEDLKIVENVLSGTVNQRIADWLSANGVACQRMSGKTERLFIVAHLIRRGKNYGYVGRIQQVNPGVVLQALAEDRVPVVSPISADENQESYNVNADSAAAALAAGAQCTDLVFVTDVPGVMVGEDVFEALTIQQAKSLIAAGTIKGGMVAKMESAFEALDQQVPRVHIIQWQGPETLHNIIQQRSTAGTTIHR
jgi:acetylglutamate kinase